MDKQVSEMTLEQRVQKFELDMRNQRRASIVSRRAWLKYLRNMDAEMSKISQRAAEWQELLDAEGKRIKDGP